MQGGQSVDLALNAVERVVIVKIDISNLLRTENLVDAADKRRLPGPTIPADTEQERVVLAICIISFRVDCMDNGIRFRC